MKRDTDERAARDEALVALDMGRVIHTSPIGLAWVLSAPTWMMSKYVSKTLVRKMVADGAVEIVDDGPRVVLKITEKGRLEARGVKVDDQETGEAGA